MKHYHVIVCPYCDCDDLVKTGHSENNTQGWSCYNCRKAFQLEYAYKPGVKEQIVDLIMNSSGVRDIG